jgi:hypothetical protein
LFSTELKGYVTGKLQKTRRGFCASCATHRAGVDPADATAHRDDGLKTTHPDHPSRRHDASGSNDDPAWRNDHAAWRHHRATNADRPVRPDTPRSREATRADDGLRFRIRRDDRPKHRHREA